MAVFGERGSLKVGGTALNRKVIWKIEGELEHEKELLTREQMDPPSVYGTSHRAVIADMMEAILANRAPQDRRQRGQEVARPGVGDVRVRADRPAS